MPKCARTTIRNEHVASFAVRQSFTRWFGGVEDVDNLAFVQLLYDRLPGDVTRTRSCRRSRSEISIQWLNDKVGMHIPMRNISHSFAHSLQFKNVLAL
jgi:hypothetical protein